MKLTVIALLTALTAANLTAQAPARATPAYLALGPMIGHTGPNDTRIWAKASKAARLAVRVGTDAELGNGRVVNGPALGSDSDYMGHVRITDLRPSTEYHYVILLDGEPAMARPYPSFTTAPDIGAPGRTRIAFSSCVGRSGFMTAAIWANMSARTRFDLLLMLGDNTYADSTVPEVQRRHYYDHRSQLGYAEITRRVPTYAIWDDHDYGPNDSDGTARGKEVSLQTFQQLWANPSYGQPDDPGIYYKFSRGEVDFFMLDSRYHRSPNRAPDDGTKTMLGGRQLAWLKRELLASRAKVKFIACGSEWEIFSHQDSWSSFARERDDIFAFLRERDLPGVVLLSGDRHFTGGYQIAGRFIEITSGPLGSRVTNGVNKPDMFLNLVEGTMCSVFDVDTTGPEPQLTLEVYRDAGGKIHERKFTWDEVNGRARIPTLPAPPPKPPEPAKK
ncbi:MAG TPA: alkaline phosphatase D family protein [Opitutaceae bacterium]|nr:alkaline phosphatase D family protein [Opitutaceae bacterium]